MQDDPKAEDILRAVSDWLRSDRQQSDFERRVAAAALDIAQRDMTMSVAQHNAEQERLTSILRMEGDLHALNAALSKAIRERAIGPETPGLLDHLWRTTLEKVAVDQPRFSLYRRLLARTGDGSSE